MIVVMHCKSVVSSYTNHTPTKMRKLIKASGNKTVTKIAPGYLYKPTKYLILGQY
jgi:hypothetical protein